MMLNGAALLGVDQIFRDGYKYKRAWRDADGIIGCGRTSWLP